MSSHRKPSFRSVERKVYKADRFALDLKAASRGPGPLAKRLVRRSLTRSLFRMFR